MRILSLAISVILSGTIVFAEDPVPDVGIALDPAGGKAIGPVFEAWLSPQQEGGEEEETPALIPDVFRSTAPSVDRNDRPSRGPGTLAFSRDFGRAYVDIRIEGVVPSEINMFHIHCGRPGQLGPIIVDFGLQMDIVEAFSDGRLTAEITNEDIVETKEHGHGLVAAFTAGCPITPAIPLDKVLTVAGMAQIAFERELYFNLHTDGQTFFGDIRGQLHPANPD